MDVQTQQEWLCWASGPLGGAGTAQKCSKNNLSEGDRHSAGLCAPCDTRLYWQAFPALRRQVLQHLGGGILIGNTSSLTEVSVEKHGQKPVGAALTAPRRVLQPACQFTLKEHRDSFWDVDSSSLQQGKSVAFLRAFKSQLRWLACQKGRWAEVAFLLVWA